MTLPPKEPKAYLEIVGSPTYPYIEGEPRHIAELEALFNQHSIPHRRGEGSRPDREALWLLRSDRDQARELLDAYKNAKGS